MCAPFLTGNGSTGATTPYNDKCSKQEGVKAGRPTPYIGAPSEVYFFSQGLSEVKQLVVRVSFSQ